jgi:hypothetical protein
MRCKRDAWDNGNGATVRLLELERRRSRVPWIFLVYHAPPEPVEAHPDDVASTSAALTGRRAPDRWAVAEAATRFDAEGTRERPAVRKPRNRRPPRLARGASR